MQARLTGMTEAIGCPDGSVELPLGLQRLGIRKLAFPGGAPGARYVWVVRGDVLELWEKGAWQAQEACAFSGQPSLAAGDGL